MTSGDSDNVATVSTSVSSTKARILEVAAELVANSPDGDVSTRAVCEAAGVGAPALYRHFGDKEGLLSAVVDHGYEKYLTTKRSRRPGTDPIQDLRDGWDTHTDFALRNPNLYRLMNSPAMRTPPAAALESHRILTADLRRAAEQGKLRLAPELAAQMIMSANVGVSLMLVSRPTTFTDETLSRRIRDAVHAVVFTAEAMGPETTSADDEQARAEEAGAEEAGAEEVLPVTATHLAALLRRTPRPDFTPGESALLGEWLDRLSNTTPE